MPLPHRPRPLGSVSNSSTFVESQSCSPDMASKFALILATVGYCGYFPIAPGTVGSAAGLALLGLVRLSGSPLVELLVIVTVCALGVWSATEAEQLFGREDPGPVVIDEVAGMLITLAWLPVGWGGALVGFLLFRVLDIVKPFPADRLEQLPGGWGIVADDVCAGLYAHVGMRVLWWLAPGWMT